MKTKIILAIIVAILLSVILILTGVTNRHLAKIERLKEEAIKEKNLLIYADSLGAIGGVRKILAEKYGITIVHPGESLWTLAERFGCGWLDLYIWNVPNIGNNPNTIYPLQQLIIPPDSFLLFWESKPPEKSILDGSTAGWVAELEYYSQPDSSIRVFVSIGFKKQNQMKFAVNASFTGHYSYRYLDDENYYGTGWLNRDVFPDEALPKYIPDGLFWAPPSFSNYIERRLKRLY